VCMACFTPRLVIICLSLTLIYAINVKTQSRTKNRLDLVLYWQFYTGIPERG